MNNQLHDKFKSFEGKIETLKDDIEKIIQDARLEGFEEGLACQVKPPTDAQFRKDHSKPVSYGEDMAYVVYSRSKKTAAKLLEVEEDYLEEIGISWLPYELDGEITIGYYIGRGTPRWTVWGIFT